MCQSAKPDGAVNQGPGDDAAQPSPSQVSPPQDQSQQDQGQQDQEGSGSTSQQGGQGPTKDADKDQEQLGGANGQSVDQVGQGDASVQGGQEDGSGQAETGDGGASTTDLAQEQQAGQANQVAQNGQTAQATPGGGGTAKEADMLQAGIATFNATATASSANKADPFQTATTLGAGPTARPSSKACKRSRARQMAGKH